MSEIDCVVINGNCLASLNRDMLQAEVAYDGLILGHMQQHEEEFINDHHDGIQKTVRTDAVVTGMLSNTVSHVLIDDVGEVHDQLLRDMFGQLQRQAILGWFVFRQGAMTPSSREQAGCVHLIRCLQTMQQVSKQQRMIFAIVQRKYEDNYATVSLTHRFFQVNPKPTSFPIVQPLLTPINSRILSGMPHTNQQSNSSQQQDNELSLGCYDTLSMVPQQGGLTTSLSANMKQLDLQQQQVNDAAELQLQGLKNIYKQVQDQLRNEIQGLQDDQKRLQEMKSTVDAMRREMYYDQRQKK